MFTAGRDGESGGGGDVTEIPSLRICRGARFPPASLPARLPSTSGAWRVGDVPQGEGTQGLPAEL